ncbi:MAG: hypothetical protein PHD60_07310 [Clostridia bacterium]|nr:hypothetical protein [Clostridia bacterium]
MNPDKLKVIMDWYTEQLNEIAAAKNKKVQRTIVEIVEERELLELARLEVLRNISTLSEIERIKCGWLLEKYNKEAKDFRVSDNNVQLDLREEMKRFMAEKVKEFGLDMDEGEEEKYERFSMKVKSPEYYKRTDDVGKNIAMYTEQMLNVYSYYVREWDKAISSQDKEKVKNEIEARIELARCWCLRRGGESFDFEEQSKFADLEGFCGDSIISNDLSKEAYMDKYCNMSKYPEKIADENMINILESGMQQVNEQIGKLGHRLQLGGAISASKVIKPCITKCR